MNEMSMPVAAPVRREHPFTYSFTTCFKERVIIDMLKANVGQNVLEMGCGSAYFATALRRGIPGSSFRYSGIDMADQALEVARTFVEPQDRLMKGDVAAMPFKDGEFDTVLYLDVIEHVTQDKKSLEEAFRVLRSGGRLIISTPNSGALLTDTFFCEYMHDHGHMDNQRPGYTAAELSALLKSAGFTIGSVQYSNVFLSELLITITKLGYRTLKPNYASQADVVEVSDSFLFNLHKKLFFPIGYLIGRLEQMLLGALMKGHCMIIEARKP
jgi:ubiquinone/menaquinone biosynthesis C-methylase UbiE